MTYSPTTTWLPPARPEPLVCPGTTTKKLPCRKERKMVTYRPADWMDVAGIRYWQMSGCADHLADVEGGLLQVMKELQESREAGRLVYLRHEELRFRFESAERRLEDLKKQEAVDRLAYEPACWAWIKIGGPLSLAPKNLAELEIWHLGRCGICGQSLPLVIDHDHWHGMVRGFLCRQCNQRECGRRQPPDAGTAVGGYRQWPPARQFRLLIPYQPGNMHKLRALPVDVERYLQMEGPAQDVRKTTDRPEG